MRKAEIAPLMRAVAGVLKEHLDGIRAALKAQDLRHESTSWLLEDMEKRLAALEQKERQP